MHAQTRVFVGREDELGRLTEFVEGRDSDATGLPLLIVGDDGVGKSALCARWFQTYTKERKGDTAYVVHFVGAASDNTPISVRSAWPWCWSGVS